MARAIGYVRVSTSEQAESGLGLTAQRKAIEVAARRLGVELAEVLADEGLSGSLALEDRPGLLAAVDALRRGDTLLVSKRDRLARDPIVTAMVERLAARKGAKVVSALEDGTNGDDPTNVLMRRMLDAFSEFERLLIGARTKAALRVKKARGERVGSVPYGFALEDGRLVPVPAEQEVLGEARRLRASGLSLRAVAAALHAAGKRARNGKAFTAEQVRRMTAGAAA